MEDLKEEVKEKKQKTTRKKLVKDAIWKGKTNQISDKEGGELVYKIFL